MSKYKVGDKVKVREDLVERKAYEGQTAVSDMVEFKGKEVTIETVRRTSRSGNDEYRIKEFDYTWTNEMFEGLVEEIKPKYVKCTTSEFRNITRDKVYEVLKEYYDGYVLEQGNYSKRYFEEVKTQIGETSEPMSIPNKGTIKYRITDDGITYITLGHNLGKSVKSGKDEADNKIGILIATARALGFNENKISGIVDVLFNDNSYDSKAKCDNAIIKNNTGWWDKSRFEEIPNPQNPVKSSVSEPINPNKLELLMPVLDVIERLQELEVDKDNIENIITRIESEGTKQEEIKYYENKIEQLEEENADLKAKICNINIDMRNILTIVNGYR